MASIFRLSFLFCLLLFLNEFGPVNLDRLDVVRRDENAGEKSGVIDAAKLAYKLLKIGAKVLPKMITLASFGNAIFRAIAGCCPDFPEACEGNKKIMQLQEEIRQKSMKIDQLQLEAQNLQEWTDSARKKFSLLVTEMGRIIDDTELMMRSVSPHIITAVNNRTVDIKKLVRDKNKVGEKVELNQVESMYESAIGSFIDISVPIFELILPSLPKIVKFAAEKLAVRRAQKLNNVLQNALKPPPPSSIQAKVSNGWFAKTKTKINTKINAIKLKINAKYSNAANILNKVGKGLSFLFNTLSTGFDIYSLVDSVRSCKEKRDNVLKAVKELTKASAQLDDILKKVHQSKTDIDEAWTTVYKQISSEPLVRDLREIQKMLESISVKNSEIEYMSSKIDDYIKSIGKANSSTPHDTTYQLLEELTLVMSQVPFTIDCFNNKVQMVNYIWNECSRGTDSFDNLYQQGIELFDQRAKLCKGKLGLLHVEPKTIKETLNETARIFHFNEDCILNSKVKKDYACQLKDSGYTPQVIATTEKITEKQAEYLIQTCPKPEISPTLRKAICSLRQLGLSDEKTAESLKLDVIDVKAVQC